MSEEIKWKEITTRPNERFGRYDPLTKATMAAVEMLQLPTDCEKDPQTALLLNTRLGCLSVDTHYLADKQANSASPTLFTYTLPSVALGEVAIRYRFTGANLTILDNDAYCRTALLESAKQIERGETKRLILIIADGLAGEGARQLGQEPFFKAAALLMQKKSSPDDKFTLSLEKIASDSKEILPKTSFFDYLANCSETGFKTSLLMGLNHYQLNLQPVDLIG